MEHTNTSLSQQIVNAHFTFNISIAILCFIFFKYFDALIEKTAVLMYKK